MIIFYDPTTNNQIRALYTHDTDAPWPGLTRLEVTDPDQIARINTDAQDLRAVVSEGALQSLEPWPRPALSASLNPLPANGLATTTITATFADPAYAEEVAFTVDYGPPMSVPAASGQAALTFGPVEVAGRYKIRCDSPTYGWSEIALEVTDA